MNFVPDFLHINKKVITPEKTIFFNEFKEKNYDGGNAIWDLLDEIADMNFENKTTTTDFFLETFLHEFAHVMHEGNLQTRIYNGFDFIKTIISMQKAQNPNFQKLKPEISEKISEYATTDYNKYEILKQGLLNTIIESRLTKDNLEKFYSLEPPYTIANVIFFIKINFIMFF